MMSIALLGCFVDSLARASLRAQVGSLKWKLIGAAALAVAGIALFAAATAARAEGNAATPLDATLLESVRSMALDKAAQPGAPRVELVIGQLDPRLHLAPCQRVEPYLPAGMRLWGKSRIGLRCTEGPTPWNVYLPITVKIFGRALVVPAGANAGSMLTTADLAEAEVDLAEEFTAAVVDPQLAVGRVLAANLKPGQTLRAGHLKARQWFAAGGNGQGRGNRRRLHARKRSAGAEQRRRRTAGARAHRERPRADRRGGRRTAGRGESVMRKLLKCLQAPPIVMHVEGRAHLPAE